MINVIRTYPLQVKVKCDKCQKETYLNKPYFKKFGWKHSCLEETLPIPPVDIGVNFIEQIVVTDNNDAKQIDPQAETEKIIKKTKRKSDK